MCRLVSAGLPTHPCSGLSVAPPAGMKRILQGLSLSALLLACAPAAYAQVSFDFHMGAPLLRLARIASHGSPGPDYVWIEGYWYPVNGQYRWHNGYWSRPPYPRSYSGAGPIRPTVLARVTRARTRNRGNVHHDRRSGSEKQAAEQSAGARLKDVPRHRLRRGIDNHGAPDAVAIQ